MLRASVASILSVTGGELLCGVRDAHAVGIAIDSRRCEPHCLFVALPGTRTDGHEHLGSALERGARVLIVTRGPAALDEALRAAHARGASVVRVADGVEAIQRLAAWHRDRLVCRVVGITGSTGKTTTKDMLVAALSTTLRVVGTRDNRNNELGVPLTILEAGADTDVLVVEMGMRGVGQIARLAAIARPDMGLITNVGSAHVEVVGSLEGIVDAKAELLEALPAQGVAVLNADDAHTPTLARRSRARVVTYGLGPGADVRADGITVDDAGRASFTLFSDRGSGRLTCPVPGRHNVYNALAAAAVALELGVALEHIASGVAAAAMTPMRMEVFSTARGITVINDAYNANPTSMRAAVETLAAMEAQGKRVAVLGDMAELGSLAELEHFQLGEAIARAGIDELVTVGELARRIAQGAHAVGMSAEHVRPCATPEEAVEVLDDLLSPGDVVLVKASRVMGLETVVEGVVEPRVG